MNDLISRNALLDAMPKNDELLSFDVRRVICNAPAVDAAPKVYARWIPNHGSYGTPHCSNCKWRIPYSEDSTLDARSFCPNCGADMVGGKEDEQ